MESLCTADFFRGNRERLRLALAERSVTAETPIVVTANGLMQRTSDNAYPFAQDSNFWYLTGIEEPDITLVMTAGKEYLVVPGRSTSREAFDGVVDAEALTAMSGIETVYSEDEGWERLRKLVSSGGVKQIATPGAPPQYIEQLGLYTNPSRARLVAGLAELLPGIELLDIRSDIASLRVIKQPAELAAIEEAIQITSDSLLFVTAPEQFALYHDEYEIEADLTREFRRRGACGHAFAPIIAGGKRACTLHNVANEAPILPDTLMVLDVGAEVSHYAADITRTKIYGQPTDRQKEVFDAVLDVQRYALTLLKPGVLLKEYEAQVATYMGETLQKLKLVTLTGDAEHDQRAIRTYYPHSTSHFLGLDVHDVGDYTLPLRSDMVLTCEPGIYIPEEGIGVRIEDDVLITTEGVRVLTETLSRDMF